MHFVIFLADTQIDPFVAHMNGHAESLRAVELVEDVTVNDFYRLFYLLAWIRQPNDTLSFFPSYSR
jgi:hypothetical protein